MAVKTELNAAAIQKLIEPYNLGTIKKVIALLKGKVNTNYCIHVENRKYIFRIYEGRSLEHISFEKEILTYLSGISEIPAPNILLNNNGKAFGKYRGKYFALFEFMEGENVSGDVLKEYGVFYTEIIQILAKLNRISTGCHFIYKDGVERCSVKDCLKTSRKNAKQMQDQNLANERLLWLEKELKTIDFPAALPSCLCHRDANLDNFLFNGEKLVAVLDFDMASLSKRICDLAGLLYWFAWNHREFIDFNLAVKIIEDYQSENPLLELEKEHIFDALKMVILMGAGWFIATHEGFLDKKKIIKLNEFGKEKFMSRLGLLGELNQ